MLEVCVTMLLLGIALTVVVTSLISVQSAVTTTDHRSATADQVRLGVQQLVQQIRSANYLYNPATEYSSRATPAGAACTTAVKTSCVPQTPGGVTGGFSFRAYTQLDGTYNCVQWRVWDQTAGGELQFRSWNPSTPDTPATDWLTVADDIVNPTSAPAFVLDSSSQFGGRLIDIDLQANSDPGDSAASTATEESSVTGRDVEYDFDSSICSSVPSP